MRGIVNMEAGEVLAFLCFAQEDYRQAKIGVCDKLVEPNATIALIVPAMPPALPPPLDML